MIVGGDEHLGSWGPGEWLIIDELGTQLTDQWPPQIETLLNEAGTLLAVRFGHYVRGLSDASVFLDWRCNDLDTLTEAVLDKVGISGRKREEHTVRELISLHFRLSSA